MLRMKKPNGEVVILAGIWLKSSGARMAYVLADASLHPYDGTRVGPSTVVESVALQDLDLLDEPDWEKLSAEFNVPRDEILAAKEGQRRAAAEQSAEHVYQTERAAALASGIEPEEAERLAQLKKEEAVKSFMKKPKKRPLRW